MGKHWRLGPSSASRWLFCPYSAQNFEEQSTQAAKRGTWLHDRVSWFLKRGVPIFGRDMAARHARLCAQFAESLRGERHVEQILESVDIPEHGGTIDLIVVTDLTLHVVDWKFGKWAVEVFQNPQIGCYLNLARERFVGKKRFFGTILQPQIQESPQTAEFSLEFLENLRRKVTEVAFSDQQTAGHHCQWCPLRRGCNAYENRPDLIAEYGFPWR